MKITSLAFAACAYALATGMASGAFAQSSVPGGSPTPTKPKVATTPTPPPGGPNTLAARPKPPTPGSGPRSVPYLGYWPSPGPKVVDDIAGPAQPPTAPRRGTGDLAARPKGKKEGLLPPCNSSDCNIESYKTDCNVVHGGLSSEPGGGISCNAGPQHRP